MAYGALSSLELTIERLLNSSHISIVQNPSLQIINLLYEEILSLKAALGEFDTKRSTINMKMVKNLEAEITDVVYKFEDVIDPHLLDQFHSQSGEEETDHPPSMLFSVDVQEIKQDIDSFIETVNKMKRAYIHELCNPSPEEEEDDNDDDDVVPSEIDFVGNESNMVGLCGLFMSIKNQLNSIKSEQKILSLYGMPGIGKTTIVEKLLQDPYIVSCYDRLVVVTIGPKYLLEDILVCILIQVNNVDDIADDIDEIMLMEGENSIVELKKMVLKSLRFLRYLIVLDDVWDTEICIELLKLFPDDNNGSRVLLTTRLRPVAKFAHPFHMFKIRLLDKKESWDLLREKVFGDQQESSSSFSYEFAKAGKKIAENCEGLPLTIVTVANILSKAEMTLEYWNEVADDKQHSVYNDAYEQMSNVLYPSYDYLEQHLKACFLYAGAFPQNNLIDGHNMTNLLAAERLLTSTDFTYVYLNHLYRKSVFLFNTKESNYYLHSSFWYLCNKEAAKTRLFYVLNFRADALSEEGNVKCQRRLCIRNSGLLLAIEYVQNLIAFAPTIRSLLCTGPYHNYPVPLCLEHLRLLKVLHVRKIRFYEF